MAKTSGHGLLLHAKISGEQGFLVSLITAERGLLRGFVRGGQKQQAKLQPGTVIDYTHTRRLSSQLGTLQLEFGQPLLTPLLAAPALLAGRYISELLCRLLPEEQSYPRLYNEVMGFYQQLSQPHMAERLALLELHLLSELGFGLPLSKAEAVPCPQNSVLSYVSPKTGRAVPADVGAPYANKLLILPELFGGPKISDAQQDAQVALAVTGYFLQRHFERAIPESREHVLQALSARPSSLK